MLMGAAAGETVGGDACPANGPGLGEAIILVLFCA